MIDRVCTSGWSSLRQGWWIRATEQRPALATLTAALPQASVRITSGWIANSRDLLRVLRPVGIACASCSVELHASLVPPIRAISSAESGKMCIRDRG